MLSLVHVIFLLRSCFDHRAEHSFCWLYPSKACGVFDTALGCSISTPQACSGLEVFNCTSDVEYSTYYELCVARELAKTNERNDGYFRQTGVIKNKLQLNCMDLKTYVGGLFVV